MSDVGAHRRRRPTSSSTRRGIGFQVSTRLLLVDAITRLDAQNPRVTTLLANLVEGVEVSSTVEVGSRFTVRFPTLVQGAARTATTAPP